MPVEAAPAPSIRALPMGGARCAAVAQLAEIQVDDKPLAVWRLNAGSAMLTTIEQLNQGQPILLVIDLETVNFSGASIEMLREHDEHRLIGRWENLSAGLAGPIGPGIYGAPVLYTPESDLEKDIWLMREALEVAALLKRGHPWQASVTVYGREEDYELVPVGVTLAANGTTYTPSPDGPPMYVGRNLTADEASVCRRGADILTGPTARNSRTDSTPLPETPAMDKIIKAMLAAYPARHHGLIARLALDGKGEGEIAAKLMEEDGKDHAAELAKLTAALEAAKTSEAAKDATIAELQAKLDEMKKAAGETETTVTGDGDPTAHLAAPKTIKEAMAKLTAEGSKLVDWDLRKAALTRWPSLRKGIPSMSGRPAA